MNRQEKDPKTGLDRAITEMRTTEPSSEILQAASDRVWSNIRQSESAAAVDSIRGCADVKQLLLQYQAGVLPPAITSPIKGTVIFPSGLTGTLTLRSGFCQTVTWS